MNAFLISFVLSLSLQFLLWRHATKTQNAGWVDFGWAMGMWMSSVVLLIHSDFSPRAWVASGILFLWSGRLAWHILSDRLINHQTEDSRYRNLRAHWGDRADRHFLWVFLGQAVLVVLFMTPAWVVSRNGGDFPNLFDLSGILIAALAVAGETLADRQLASFRQDPTTPGQVCRRGFWKYSRHPNYFCEWLHWFGYVLLGVGGSFWLLTFLGPIFMYVFLRFVTGVPHAERQSLKSRGEAYREYQQTTPVFFPWIPHSSSSAK